jgi:hypothetical protein
MKRLVWLAPALLILAACSGASSSPTSGGFTTTSGGGAPAADFAVGKGAVAVPAPAQVAAGGQGGTNGVPVPQAFDATRSVILTANIAMKAADPWATAEKAQAVATALGGDVIGLNESGGKDDRVASLTLRVPSLQFTEALRRLRALEADVTSSTVTGQDVSDQFVDLKARLAAKQLEEQRYLALLNRADNKVDDILKIDGVLSNVRTQIEQLQGQVNSIEKRTQFSTITVSINMPVAAIVPPTTPAWDPARTVALAIGSLAAVLRGLADIAIWMLVFGWIPLVGLAIAFGLTRGRRPVRTPA